MLYKKLLLIIAFCFFFTFNSFADDVALIVNTSNPQSNITTEKLYAIYTSTIKSFDNGEPIQIYLLPIDSAETIAFFNNELGVSISLIQSLYQENEVSGRSDFAPKIIQTSDDIQIEIAYHLGGLGYVLPSNVTIFVRELPIK